MCDKCDLQRGALSIVKTHADIDDAKMKANEQSNESTKY